jgi:tripartite-type tricarboxylate transporter receptor subunit TctC
MALKKLAVAALSLMMSWGWTAASAEEWPSKTIRLIVPYAPGGYTDTVGRITGNYLQKALGQTVVVENRAGGGGIVGTDFVSKLPGDGYVLCVCSIGAVSIAPIAQGVKYDPLKDLTPISIISTIPQTVILNPSVPAKSMQELVDYAKANPGKLSFGSSGAAGLMYFSVALFQARTGIKMTHVPFKGGAPATAAVVSGEVSLSFTNMTDALPQMEANTVRAIAVTGKRRSEFAPNLPTVAEAILPNYSAESWNGILAPGGTPAHIVDKLSEALKKMAADPEVKKAMAVVGASTVYTTPEQFRSAITTELEQWKELMKEIRANKT